MLGDARTLTLNSMWQNPGGVAWFGGITSAVFGVNTTSLGADDTPWPVVQTLPHVSEMVPSPSYSTNAPSSVQGNDSGKLELQSRSKRTFWMVSCVPPVMLPVPNEIRTLRTSPGTAKFGPLT